MSKNYKDIPELQLSVTTDVVMLRMRNDNLQILLVKRDAEPFENMWSLPGGFVSEKENFEDTLRQKIKEKTGYSDMYMEQLYTFGEPDRDPRGRIISVAYVGFISDNTSYTLSERKNKETTWATLVPEKRDNIYSFKIFVENEEVSLAFDHNSIVQTALERIVNKIWYTTIIYKLLPAEFTLLDAKKIFEIFLCKVVNNFHRRVKDVVEETGNIKSGQAYRPAKLFKVKEQIDND